ALDAERRETRLAGGVGRGRGRPTIARRRRSVVAAVELAVGIGEQELGLLLPRDVLASREQSIERGGCRRGSADGGETCQQVGAVGREFGTGERLNGARRFRRTVG